MINAMQEYLKEVKGKTVKCAYVYKLGCLKEQGLYSLPINYTVEELKVFTMSLNFCYYNGHGIQELDGMIWYADGTWSIRGEYDGAEWWEYQQVPDIPEFLVK